MKLSIQPVKGGANILDLTVALIMFAVAEAGAAKVKAQHRKAKTVQRLHGVENNLVMQCPAKQGMGMANYCGVRRVPGAGIQQRFQAACGAFEEERLDG